MALKVAGEAAATVILILDVQQDLGTLSFRRGVDGICIGDEQICSAAGVKHSAVNFHQVADLPGQEKIRQTSAGRRLRSVPLRRAQ